MCSIQTISLITDVITSGVYVLMKERVGNERKEDLWLLSLTYLCPMPAVCTRSAVKKLVRTGDAKRVTRCRIRRSSLELGISFS